MPGYAVLYIWCACGRVATIPGKPELESLLRDELLARLRCKACGRRAQDLRRGWEIPGKPGYWGP